jgi:hypothetical protein
MKGNEKAPRIQLGRIQALTLQARLEADDLLADNDKYSEEVRRP